MLKKILRWLVVGSSLVVLLGYGTYRYSLRGYSDLTHGLHSDLAPSLAVFIANQSTHHDPVKGCWYDSGDYLIMASRNAQSLWYLALAATVATDANERSDILRVVEQQKTCLEQMLASDYKQFRDQDSHGPNVPPLFNELFFPQRDYILTSDEGRDIYLWLALTYDLLGEGAKADAARAEATQRLRKTSAGNCCEEGPLELPDQELGALERLAGVSTTVAFDERAAWALHPTTYLALQEKNIPVVRNVLLGVKGSWDNHGKPFQYIGGNYDIAGTIVLERLYRAQTGDTEFVELATTMRQYLRGSNPFQTDFTHFSRPYHPCIFFNVCDLKETLVNGVDETGRATIDRPDPWRVAEIQLTGQAQYVLLWALEKNP